MSVETIRIRFVMVRLAARDERKRHSTEEGLRRRIAGMCRAGAIPDDDAAKPAARHYLEQINNPTR
jgi:hypothetical protein